MDKKYYETLAAEERRRKNRIHNAVLYTVGGLLVLVGIIIIINDQTYLFDKLGKWLRGEKEEMPTFPPYVMETELPEDETPAPGVPTEVPVVTEVPDPAQGAPVCVYFPQYDIICPVDPVGYNWKGQMDTVRAYDRAGWLQTSGTPITGGNILIAGHNRYSGKLGYFSVIKDELQVGDQVIIEMANGNLAYYIVESIDRWKYDELPDNIMRLDEVPRLTLITCYGDYSAEIGSSIHRVIAVCKPVDGMQG